ERVAKDPLQAQLGSVVGDRSQGWAVRIERVRLHEDAAEEPPPEPGSDAFVSDDDLAAHAHDACHLAQCTTQLTEGIYPAEMVGRVEGVVGKRKIRRVRKNVLHLARPSGELASCDLQHSE